MRASRVVLGLAFAAPASALLVGCGSSAPSETEQYGEQFTEVAQPLTSGLIDLGNAMATATSRKQVSAALGRVEGILEDASAGFEALDPPDEVADTQATLIAAIGKFERKVEATREVARSGTDREFQNAVADFNSESQAFASALGEIGSRLRDAGVPLDDGSTTDSG